MRAGGWGRGGRCPDTGVQWRLGAQDPERVPTAAFCSLFRAGLCGFPGSSAHRVRPFSRLGEPQGTRRGCAPLPCQTHLPTRSPMARAQCQALAGRLGVALTTAKLDACPLSAGNVPSPPAPFPPTPHPTPGHAERKEPELWSLTMRPVRLSQPLTNRRVLGPSSCLWPQPPFP